MKKKSPSPPAIVLVRPQMAENIGAAARAMVNFGASDLRLVCPQARDMSLAERMACDGRGLLRAARTFPSLAAAVAGCAFTVATTRRARRIKLPAVTPAAVAEQLCSLPADSACALVFGAEQSGLSNEELFLCDAASTIPATENGSLNLGQAVVVYLYAWFQAALARETAGASRPCRPTRGRRLAGDSCVWDDREPLRLATHEEKQRAYDLLGKLLVAGRYKPIERLPEFMRRVKLLFEQRPLNEREQRILLKLLRYLEKLIP